MNRQALEKENQALRRRLKALTEEAGYNEAVLARFQERELALLTCEGLSDLIHAFTHGMRQSFGLDDIGLLLHDPKDELAQLLQHNGTPAEQFPQLQLLPDIEDIRRHVGRGKRPLLGRWDEPQHHSLLKRQQLQSVALLPLLLRHRLVGCLTLGSRDPARFTPQHATDFLQRLATVGAVCLENAVNRERIVLSGLTDALTGLYNRRYLQRRIGEEIARAKRYQQPLSCLFLDIDHFKQVNDNYGHGCGDAVLREVAGRVRDQLRASDIPTRYGGEEFTLLLPQTSADEAMHLAERIRQAVARSPIEGDEGQLLKVTVSIGVSELAGRQMEQIDDPAGMLLNAADGALYRAKAAGRNQVMLTELSGTAH